MKQTTNFNGHSVTMTRVDLNEKRKFSFFATALLRKEKNEMPTLNFSSRFLSSPSFSTFAVYFLLCVEKITHNKKLAKPPTTKELNPTRKTKTRAKKFSLYTYNQNVLQICDIMQKSKIYLMTLYIPVLLGMLLSFSSCEKIDVPKGTPKCIKNKIKDEKDRCLDKVYQYDYNGKTVYYFNLSCPDALHCVYDDDCNTVCCPDGGISGTGDGKCSAFFQNATNQKLIWQK